MLMRAFKGEERLAPSEFAVERRKRFADPTGDTEMTEVVGAKKVRDQNPSAGEQSSTVDQSSSSEVVMNF